MLSEIKEKLPSIVIVNSKFIDNWFNFVWQSTAVGVLTGFSIYFFGTLMGQVLVVGTASTFFTVFTIPTNRTAKVRNILGSYLISIITAYLGFYFFSYAPATVISVILASFLMDITDTEHPPAAGIVLGLLLSANREIFFQKAYFALSSAVLSVLLKYFLAPYLIDLIPEGGKKVQEPDYIELDI